MGPAGTIRAHAMEVIGPEAPNPIGFSIIKDHVPGKFSGIPRFPASITGFLLSPAGIWANVYHESGAPSGRRSRVTSRP